MTKLYIITFSMFLVAALALNIKALEPEMEPLTNKNTTAHTSNIDISQQNISPSSVKSPQSTNNKVAQSAARSNETNLSNTPVKNSGGISFDSVKNAMSNAGTTIKNAVNSVKKSISIAANNVALSAKSTAKKMTGSPSQQTSTSQKATAEQIHNNTGFIY